MKKSTSEIEEMVLVLRAARLRDRESGTGWMDVSNSRLYRVLTHELEVLVWLDEHRRANRRIWRNKAVRWMLHIIIAGVHYAVGYSFAKMEGIRKVSFLWDFLLHFHSVLLSFFSTKNVKYYSFILHLVEKLEKKIGKKPKPTFRWVHSNFLKYLRFCFTVTALGLHSHLLLWPLPCLYLTYNQF